MSTVIQPFNENTAKVLVCRTIKSLRVKGLTALVDGADENGIIADGGITKISFTELMLDWTLDNGEILGREFLPFGACA